VSIVTPDLTFNTVSMQREKRTHQRGDVQQGQITSYLDSGPQLWGALQRLETLRQLPENWDTYGSREIQGPALAGALQLLMWVDQGKFPVPQLLPVSGGGIQAEWSSHGRSLEIVIMPDGAAEYIRVYDEDHIEDGDLTSFRDPEILKHMYWFALGAEPEPIQ
jgi:hypothetical protein